MQITRKSEWSETKFELFIKTPCLNNNIYARISMSGHNITCSWTFQKLRETVRHGTRLPCLVPPGRLCRTRGTTLETSGTNQGNNRRTRMFCHHLRKICAHDTHNPRFSRPALRKQFSTHDAVDIIIMFRVQLFTLISLPAFRFAHAWFNILSFLSQTLII